MKTFFASLLGTLAALLLVVIGTTVAGFALIAAMAAMGQTTPSLENDSFLVLDLDANISDSPEQFNDSALADALMGNQGPAVLQLRAVTRALDRAATDKRITGLFITGALSPSDYGSSFAALSEVRDAIERFKASGKPVRAYFVSLGTREFFLGSVANELILDPAGAVFVPGLASQPTFYAGAFERFGIGVQIVRVGKFKSAVEPYTRRDLSPESREQLQVLLNDLWGPLKTTIAQSRGLTPEAFQVLVDTNKAAQPEQALASGLVDRLAFRDEVLDELKSETGKDADDRTFRQISLAQYAHLAAGDTPGNRERHDVDGSVRGGVAVVYAEGAIVDGEGGIDEVGGDRFARELRRLRLDPDIKALVVRVNSPGGSVTASEHILRELRVAGERMPVVISMGGMAASGGYWISMHSNRIFAEPMTITGSIGVFGMLPNIQKLGNDLGITWDTVKTGAMADMNTIARPKTEAEMALLQGIVDKTYQDFLTLVSDSRGLPVSAVNDIAQGRVWSGKRGAELGLVDEIGGLSEAIAYAAREADLTKNFSIEEFPKKKELSEAIAELIERLQPRGARVQSPVHALIRRIENEVGVLAQFNDPRQVYARLPLEIAAP